MREQAIKSETGFHIDELDGIWYLSGCPKKEYRFREFNSAYDIEKMLEERVPFTKGMEKDSESCALFIYFPSKSSAIAYLKKVEKYLNKVKELV